MNIDNLQKLLDVIHDQKLLIKFCIENNYIKYVQYDDQLFEINIQKLNLDLFDNHVQYNLVILNKDNFKQYLQLFINTMQLQKQEIEYLPIQKEIKIKPISLQWGKTLKLKDVELTENDKLQDYLDGKITQQQLVKHFILKNGVYYDKNVPVFCTDLFGIPCPMCSQNVSEKNVNILIQLVCQQWIGKYVKIIYQNIDYDQRSPKQVQDYNLKCYILITQLKMDIFNNIDDKVRSKIEAEFVIKLLILALYQQNFQRYGLIFDEKIFDDMIDFTKQMSQSYLIQKGDIKFEKELSKIIIKIQNNKEEDEESEDNVSTLVQDEDDEISMK